VARTLGAVVLVCITTAVAVAVGYEISRYASEWVGGPVGTFLVVSGARTVWVNVHGER
jgi:hypothetical protein